MLSASYLEACVTMVRVIFFSSLPFPASLPLGPSFGWDAEESFRPFSSFPQALCLIFSATLFVRNKIFFLLIKKYRTRLASVLARHQSDDLYWQFIIWVTRQQGQESLKLTSPHQAEFHYIIFPVKICFLRGEEKVINRLDTSQALGGHCHKLSYVFNPAYQIAFIILHILHILTEYLTSKLFNHVLSP